MVPFIIYAEKKRRMKRVLTGAVATLLACELFFLVFGHSLAMLVVGTVVFFTAFNLLEASLPSLVSKVSPAGGRGTAMGCIPPASSSARRWRHPRRLDVPARRAEHGVHRMRGARCPSGWRLLLPCANRLM